jgi:cytoskeletal protein CcmA (bactofilin family)
MSSDLRYHKASNTYIARRRSYFENDVIIDGNFIAGAAASFWKGLSVKGTLKLGKESSVRGNVKADDIVIGPGCEINGNVEAYNDLKLFDSVTVKGLAIAGGTISIRPGCSLGFARANATLELIGKVHIKEIESGTKIIVRSE